MEIKYIRKLMSSHMVIAQEMKLADWEEKMIAHTKREGILFAECVRENGQNYLWYDITGKQSLDTIVESGRLGHELLCKILLGLYESVEYLEQFLLRAEGILLMPECIFLDYRSEQISFCYYPGMEDSLAQSLMELFEYLLERLDHGDERAVELAYGVYEQISKGDISIKEMMEYIHIPYEKEENADETGMNPSYVYQREEQLIESKEAEGTPQEECREEKSIEEWSEPRKKETIKTKLMKNCSRKNGQSKKDVMKSIFLGTNGQSIKEYDIVNWITRSLSKMLHMKQADYCEEKEESFVFEPEEEVAQQNTRPTVLLSTIAQKPEGILRYEGKEPLCSDLQITGSSYVIGSERNCDGCIPSTTVSRRHARITVKEDIYFIEDLNSSNGTYVGGEMLGYKHKVSLQKNEIVIFADEKFRFI